MNPPVFAAVADTSNFAEAPQPVVELAEEPINPAPADPGTGPVNTNNEEGPLEPQGQAFVQTGVPPQPQPGGGPPPIVPAIQGRDAQLDRIHQEMNNPNPPVPAGDLGTPITGMVNLQASERFTLRINGTYTNPQNGTLTADVNVASFQAFRQSDGRIRVVFYTLQSAQPGLIATPMEVFSIIFNQQGWSDSVSIAPAYATRLGIDPGTARLQYTKYFANTGKWIVVDFFRIVAEARQFPSRNFALRFLWINGRYTDGSPLPNSHLLRQRVTR